MIATDSHNQVSDAREMALASAVLLDPGCLDGFPEFNASVIRDEFSGLVVATALRMHRDGQPVDVYRVADALDRGGALVEKCGPDAVHRLVSLVTIPLTTDPVGIARDIHREAQRRRFRFSLEAMLAGVDDPTVSIDSLSRQVSSAGELLGDQFSGIESFTSAELDAGQFDHSYLVEDVLAARQDCVLGAPKKCLKTNMSIDLNLSLASGARFLNKFYVPRAVRTALISGESGKPTIQETARRVARSKPWINLADYENAFWSFDLPQLSDHASLIALRDFIRKHRLEVIILDPAYLMLCIGDDAANLFKMGPMLRLLTKLGNDEGCTIIIVHHLKKDVAVTTGPPELEGIAWAGFQEWARQWLLMSRRVAYDTDRPGHHELWFTAGGSAGHSVGKALDIEEGDRRDQGGRRWEVDVLPIGEAVEAKIEAAQTAKEQRQQVQHEKAVTNTKAKVIEALEANHDGLTARRFKAEYGISSMLLMAAVHQLINDGAVKECEITAANKQTYQGWQLSKYSVGTTGNDRELVQCSPVTTSDTHTALHCAPLL